MPFLLRGAMRVTVSLPCLAGRWPTSAFGVLGGGNTCLFRDSASTSASSMRLFFERFCIALKQALSDPETGISVGMIAHLARFAQHQSRTWSIACTRLAGIVAHDQAMTAVTLTTCVARIHAAGDHAACIPRLIFARAENAALHPVGAFGVATTPIPALFRLEIAQMLEDENACSMRGCELDNTRAHQMRHMLVAMAYLGPEGGIILLVFGDDASLRSVACNPAKRTLPKARYPSTAADEAGGEDGAFDSLDGANGNVFSEIKIHSADLRLCVGDLLCYFGWRSEGLLDGGMQPPLRTPTNQGRTLHLKVGREVAPKRANLDPGPARSGPDFEHDTMILSLFPEAGVERSRLLPGAWRDGRALPEGPRLCALAELFGFVLLLAGSPFFERGGEGASRSQSCIDGRPPKHGRDTWRDVVEWQDGRSMLLRRMGEPLQGCERLFVGESQDARVCLDTSEVEGHDAVEESGILRKVVGILRLIVQTLPDRRRGLGHVCFLLAPCATPITEYSIARTLFQPPKGARQARAKAWTRLTAWDESQRLAAG